MRTTWWKSNNPHRYGTTSTGSTVLGGVNLRTRERRSPIRQISRVGARCFSFRMPTPRIDPRRAIVLFERWPLLYIQSVSLIFFLLIIIVALSWMYTVVIDRCLLTFESDGKNHPS